MNKSAVVSWVLIGVFGLQGCATREIKVEESAPSSKVESTATEKVGAPSVDSELAQEAPSNGGGRKSALKVVFVALCGVIGAAVGAGAAKYIGVAAAGPIGFLVAEEKTRQFATAGALLGAGKCAYDASS